MYSYIPEDCGVEDCLIEEFDYNVGDGTEDCPNTSCDDACRECARKGMPCDCTCKQYDFRMAVEVNSVPPGSDPTGTNFEFCECPGADGPVNSIPETAVITGGYLQWDDGVASPDFAAISAQTCPDNPDWTLTVWQSTAGYFLPSLQCVQMPTTPSWGAVVAYTNPTCDGDTDLSRYFNFTPPSIPDTPRYSCDPLRLPPAFFVVATNGCGDVMAACPILFPAHDSVTCPDIPPPDCPTATMTTGFSDGCEEGEAQIHLAVTVALPEGCDPCGGSAGTVTWSSGAFGGTLDPFSDPGASYSFVVPCEEGGHVEITVTFSCDPTCDGCEPVTKIYCIPIDGGPFTTGPC